MLTAGLVTASASAQPPPPARDWARVAALRSQGKLVEVFQLLQGWLAENPNDARVLHEMGVLYALDHQPDAAVLQFQRALAANPDAVETRRNLSELLRSRGRCPDAIEHYRELLMVDLGDGVALRGIAVCYESSGQRDRALGALAELEKRFQGKDLGLWAAERRAKLEAPKAAPAVATAAAPAAATVPPQPVPQPTSVDPGGEPSALECDREGEALFRERRYDAAAHWLGEALRLEATAERAYRLALAFAGHGDALAALGTLQRALRLDPHHLPSLSAWPTVARAARARGKGGLDVAFARPDAAPAALIGQALVEGDLMLARQLLAATRGGPWQGAVLATLEGEVLLRDGRWDGALKAFQSALAQQPRYPPAQKGLAEVYVQMGRYSGARELVGLPVPIVAAGDDPNADLRRMVKLRRAEFEHQLRLAADPGLKVLPALVDQVLDSSTPPPPAPVVAMPQESVPVHAPPTKGRAAKARK